MSDYQDSILLEELLQSKPCKFRKFEFDVSDSDFEENFDADSDEDYRYEILKVIDPKDFEGIDKNVAGLDSEDVMDRLQKEGDVLVDDQSTNKNKKRHESKAPILAEDLDKDETKKELRKLRFSSLLRPPVNGESSLARHNGLGEMSSQHRQSSSDSWSHALLKQNRNDFLDNMNETIFQFQVEKNYRVSSIFGEKFSTSQPSGHLAPEQPHNSAVREEDGDMDTDHDACGPDKDEEVVGMLDYLKIPAENSTSTFTSTKIVELESEDETSHSIPRFSMSSFTSKDVPSAERKIENENLELLQIKLESCLSENESLKSELHTAYRKIEELVIAHSKIEDTLKKQINFLILNLAAQNMTKMTNH